jgi:hypothetical protein
MSRRRRPRRSTARMVAWYLTALAAIGVVAVAHELLRHGLLAVLALAGPLAGYLAGRVHGARRVARGRRTAAPLPAAWRPAVQDQPAESPGPPAARRVTRARLLAEPRSGARPLRSDR